MPDSNRPAMAATNDETALETPVTRHWFVDRFALSLGLVATAGLFLRVAYVLLVRDNRVAGDGLYYQFAGNLLADGNGFIHPLIYILEGAEVPAAVHPPAWPVLLAVPSLLTFDTHLGHQLFACLIGAATIVMVGVVGRRVGGWRTGLIAAVIAALYPNFWLYERELMAEPLVLLLGAVVLLLSLRFRDRPGAWVALGLGVLCGLLALTRSDQLLLLPVLIAPLIMLAAGISRWRRLVWLALAGGAAATVIAPWAVYNTIRFEGPVLLSTNLGPTMTIGTCDLTFYGDNIGYFDRRCLVEVGSESMTDSDDASTRNRELQRQALEYLGDNPRRVPTVVTAREGRTWGLLWPFEQMRLETSRGTGAGVIRLAFLCYWFLLPAAVAGAVLLRRRGVWLWPFLSFLVVTAVTVAFTYGETRYRNPVEVPIVVLAAVAIDELLPRWRNKPVDA
jgi:4-amino-4-deoxy-L-arabinose transferase-like glycosyltransferase